MKEAVKQKTLMMRKWLKNRTVETRFSYVEARNKAEIVKRMAKEDTAKRIAEEMAEDSGAQRKKIFRLAKTYRRSQKKVCNIKDKKREILIRPEDINKRWTEYFDELLNGEEQREDAQEEIDEQEAAEEITMEEFEEALKKRKNNKSPGEDGIPIELIKEGEKV